MASFLYRSRKMWNLAPKTQPLAAESIYEGVTLMKTSLLVLAAAAMLSASATAPANAQRGVAAGVAAGIVGGAIVGGALASPYYNPGYYYGPGYAPYAPRYYGSGYAADDYYGGCVWQTQRFWDGFGWRVRRVRVCG